MSRLETTIGRTRLKNPLIAAAAEQFIEGPVIETAIRAGAGAIVVKSVNESMTARAQLEAAEYVALDGQWRPVPWGPEAPREAFLATRSGMYPYSFDKWLAQFTTLDKVARQHDCVLVATLILSGLDQCVVMAKQIEAAGAQVLELNIGTPYAT